MVGTRRKKSGSSDQYLGVKYFSDLATQGVYKLLRTLRVVKKLGGGYPNEVKMRDSSLYQIPCQLNPFSARSRNRKGDAVEGQRDEKHTSLDGAREQGTWL